MPCLLKKNGAKLVFSEVFCLFLILASKSLKSISIDSYKEYDYIKKSFWKT